MMCESINVSRPSALQHLLFNKAICSLCAQRVCNPLNGSAGLNHLDSGENLDWAHRAKPYVPAARNGQHLAILAKHRAELRGNIAP